MFNYLECVRTIGMVNWEFNHNRLGIGEYNDKVYKIVNQIRLQAMDDIMPILISIVDRECCFYGFEDDITKLEQEWQNLKGEE